MLKRITDICVATIGLVLLFPFFFIVAILIKLDSPGPVFFMQERVGLNGKLFKIFKFRSMYINSENNTQLTKGDKDPRITKIGHYIRKLHIDELIQLINVLYGEMSLVGPRPEVLKYTKYYIKDWDYVLQVAPGITGLTQIMYLNKEYKLLSQSQNPEKTYISILPKKLRLDKFYVKHHNFCLDLKIIFLTARQLFN
jgi:lipopolysaccharide/colanic/teichoic acid biosynthesis glycosyltransferase